jgi:hypothetical protein
MVIAKEFNRNQIARDSGELAKFNIMPSFSLFHSCRSTSTVGEALAGDPS